MSSSRHLNSNIRLIDRKGNDSLSLVTISQVIDPSNPLNIINTETLDAISSFQGTFKQKEIDGDLVRNTDIKLYVDPSTVSSVPKIDDKVTDGTTTYNIQRVTTYRDKDIVCLYILQIRE